MRTKIKIKGKYYRPVPWHVPNECNGCIFQEISGCPHEDTDCCDLGAEFDRMILIPATKQGMADYIAKKLEGSPKKGEDE